LQKRKLRILQYEVPRRINDEYIGARFDAVFDANEEQRQIWRLKTLSLQEPWTDHMLICVTRPAGKVRTVLGVYHGMLDK
jgi:hypothetical protein